MLLHFLTNFEMQRYYQNKYPFNGVYLFIQEITNRYEYKSVVTLWIALYVKGNNVTIFDSFRVEHIPKGI